MRVPFAVPLLVFCLLVLPVLALGQWQLNGAPVAVVINDQFSPTIASDGEGGAIVTWFDFRGNDFDIYAQRVSATGAALWTTNGVVLCNAPLNQSSPMIVPDGAGGAIVAWQDNRSGNFDIYAQRVSATGTVQWTENGVALCRAVDSQLSPTIVADGAGGAIVTWEDSRTGTNADIYCQRVSALGEVLWATNGVFACTAPNHQRSPVGISDGAGGAILAWHDLRSGDRDVYAQRLNSLGEMQWIADGVALCTAFGEQTAPTIISDQLGGAIVMWQDFRSGDYDVYAQRVSASGVVPWRVNGTLLCASISNQESPEATSDGQGGAIIVWSDARAGAADIYAQRIGASGNTQWGQSGSAVCTFTGDQRFPVIVLHQDGGAIVTWQDGRNLGQLDIYAQRLDDTGAMQWPVTGVAVCTANGAQDSPVMIADGEDGAIVTWADARNGFSDVFVQRFEDRYGFWGHPEPHIDSVADVPGDQGGRVVVSWKAGDWDAINLRTVTHYSIWRATDELTVEGLSGDVVTAPTQVTPGFRGRAYWIQHAPEADYYWEWIGKQDAKFFSGYSFTAETRTDSTSQGTAEHHFLVISETSDVTRFWPSNPAAGHSVDNLAPAAPIGLTAQRVGTDVQLSWDRVQAPDIQQYSVYRSTRAGVAPTEANFLASVADTLFIDPDAPTSALFYVVTATDVHENHGEPSNEAHIGTGSNLPPITGLTVLQNHPNPFAESTVLRVGVPAAGPIEVDIYDVAGRKVREVTLSGAQGWQEVVLPAVDVNGRPLASGVYFCRVRAGTESIARKMVIAR